MKKCDRNKSPGMDGLPYTYEFYQITWDIIGKDFVEVLHVQLSRFNLIESDRHRTTRLTSTVDGVPTVTPITLVNWDYKILIKSFVEKLCPDMQGKAIKFQCCSM